ncbi:hypothetical protein KVR01_000855 [Diaporthe batatas]|uniref:uncharacterized protein n=1 Tax=Diaporthe batatas TaxID=748121 RepID=UPI001D058A3E|nr:uncharacterized protein KVR01_000855 [Diaporthe batatas]KAG8170110.1 hypothetical protein KVR01_000855 [Diaporthe batatas]
MFSSQKRLNKVHILIVLAILSVLATVLVLLDFSDTSVLIDSLKHYEQVQAASQKENHASGSPRPPHQGQNTWYGNIWQKLQKKQYCKWEFSHYEASEYEEQWFSIIHEAQHDICSVVARPEHAEKSTNIVRRIESLLRLDPNITWTDFDTMPHTEPVPEDRLFSRMHYHRKCYDDKLAAFRPSAGRGVQLIEPLWGMLRDPFDPWCGAKRLTMPGWDSRHENQSKEAIMPMGFAPYAYDAAATSAIGLDDHRRAHLWRTHGVPPWHSHLTPSQDPRGGGMTVFEKPRNVFVDLGSSYFEGWAGPGGTAASGRWFYDTYHARGRPFDTYVAVEVEKLDPTLVQSQLPPDLVGIYNLINIPLTMDKGDKLNAVDLFKRISKPGDFFVLKLDIDSAPIEVPIIKNLLADNPENGGASANIDELMVEHHVVYPPMTGPEPWRPWGDLDPAVSGDLAYSYTFFRDLRKKGIRSHSWP